MKPDPLPRDTSTARALKDLRVAPIFLSRSERRLRAGWRLLAQVLLQSVLTVLVGLFLLILWRGQLPGEYSGRVLAETEFGQLIAVTASIAIVRRLLDHRSFASLGVRSRRALPDAAVGFAIALLIMALVFCIEFSQGWLQIVEFAWQVDSPDQVLGSVALYLGICALVGWNEELMSRGYHLQTLASGLTVPAAWILSSLIFGVLHIGNPHAGAVGVIGIVLAGLFLGVAYLRTGSLWLSIGLHMGWNFAEGVVFGFPVSGLSFYRLITPAINGPALWTGGDFGPEGGLVMLPALLLGAMLVLGYTRSRVAT